MEKAFIEEFDFIRDKFHFDIVSNMYELCLKCAKHNFEDIYIDRDPFDRILYDVKMDSLYNKKNEYKRVRRLNK